MYMYLWKIYLNNKRKANSRLERGERGERTRETRRNGEFYVIRLVFDLFGIERAPSLCDRIFLLFERRRTRKKGPPVGKGGRKIQDLEDSPAADLFFRRLSQTRKCDPPTSSLISLFIF